MAQDAVEVRSVYKRYGSKRNGVQALQDCSLTVPQGCIYGLLGPSGSGKTTLLRALVGRLEVDAGHVTVLGQKPGARGHEVPGKLIGYMPQDTALFEKLTIEETLAYFGRILGMSRENAVIRTDFLVKFLDLPSKGRQIQTLSGGQKRRVSFACALIHEPRLLILDEPTVGVDPLLRQKIWEHLLEIAKTGHTTILLTTHYIEEARQADMVGLMRQRKLLAESSPEHLLITHRMETLEDVFLKLCQQDSTLADTAEPGVTTDGLLLNTTDNTVYTDDSLVFQGAETSAYSIEFRHHGDRSQLLEDSQRSSTSKHYRHLQPGEFSTNTHSTDLEHSSKCCTRCWSWFSLPKPTNILALVIKNLIIMSRNLGFLFFEFMLPSIQIILFCLCIGPEPRDLTVAIVNQDQGMLGMNCGAMVINHLSNETFAKVNYSDLTSALNTVKQGDAWGAVFVGKNFTQDLFLRVSNTSSVDNKTIDGSSVKLYLDMTNQQIALSIQQEIMTGFQAFTTDMLRSLGLNVHAADLPVKLEEPVYGDRKPSFTNFMAPGIIISITFFMACGLTALAFVLERKEGLLDRSLTTGVNVMEVMVAHVLTQFLVLIVQMALLFVFTLLVFKVPSRGPVIWAILLVLIEGFAGMSLGLLISAVCDKEQSAIQAALGTAYPVIILSGIIWPLEAMPPWLRYVSIAMPSTYAAEAMRCILSRGWDITYMEVWRGFLVAIGWGWGLCAIAAIIIKIKKW